MWYGLALLLKAVEVVEKKNREDSDHGYACLTRPQSKSFSTYKDLPVQYRKSKNLKRSRSISMTCQRAFLLLIGKPPENGQLIKSKIARKIKQMQEFINKLPECVSSVGAERDGRVARSCYQCENTVEFISALMTKELKAILIKSSHNELEKNRRAHMRHCFEELKKVVPLGGSSNRHTTQGVLISARQCIVSMKAAEVSSSLERDKLMREQNKLRACLSSLQDRSEGQGTWVSYRRSYSESSGTSNLSISPTSESEHIDVVGLGSNHSLDVGESFDVRTTTVCKPKSGYLRLMKPDCGFRKKNRSGSNSPCDIEDAESLDSGCDLSPINKIAFEVL